MYGKTLNSCPQKRKRETNVAHYYCVNDVFSFLLHRVQRAFSQKNDEEETTTRFSSSQNRRRRFCVDVLFFFEAKCFLLHGTTTTSTRGTLRFFCRRPRNEWISKSTSLRRRSDRRRKRREREHVRSRTQTGVRGNGASSFGLEFLSPSLCVCVCAFRSNRILENTATRTTTTAARCRKTQCR